jgi:FAD synthetase
MAFGTFDILHYGHVTLLEKARALGGENVELIVIIARDSTVVKEKGHTPIFPEKERLGLIKALKAVDDARLGHEGPDHLKIIEELKPDLIALGYDQNIDADFLRTELEKRGLKNIKIQRLEKYGTPGLNSSSKILDKLLAQIQKLLRFYS